MPSPSPSRSKGKEPPCGRLPPGLNVRRSFSPSSPKEFSKNYAPQASGASTQGHQKAKSSMNALSLPSTAKECGGGRRSVNTHKTPHGLQERRALRVTTSPTSIPTSPNYFDVLSEEEEEDRHPAPPTSNRQEIQTTQQQLEQQQKQQQPKQKKQEQQQQEQQQQQQQQEQQQQQQQHRQQQQEHQPQYLHHLQQHQRQQEQHQQEPTPPPRIVGILQHSHLDRRPPQHRTPQRQTQPHLKIAHGHLFVPQPNPLKHRSILSRVPLLGAVYRAGG